MKDRPTNIIAATSRARAQILLIPVAALVAVIPLIHHGCSCGHDIDFHLLNWMEAARQFAHGSLHPHWAFTPAFNAGEPRFVFYPPISWTLGALLGLLLTHLPGVSESAAWSSVPIVFTWIALTFSGFTMHRLARMYVGRNAALLAAIVYLANPYMLFTAYERTAYAELLAAAWIPLLFHAILRERVTLARIALPVAFLWLTNAPAAIMGSYTLAILAALRVAYEMRTSTRPIPLALIFDRSALRRQSAGSVALSTIAGTLLGLALAAFYIVPAAYERRFIQVAMATISGMQIDQNFLFEQTGTSGDALLHDQVLHTASVVAILLLVTSALTLCVIFFQQRKRVQDLPLESFPARTLAILAAGIALMLTPITLPLWNHIPQASLLQFPWRLLAMLAPIAALGLAAASDWMPLRVTATALSAMLLAVVLSHASYSEFVQPCDVQGTPGARLALFRSNAGTDPTDEYTPTTADNDSLKPGDPPYWLAASAEEGPPASAQPDPAPLHFTVNAPRAEELVLNLRDYPAWQVKVNGTFASVRDERADGLIAVPIPAGVDRLDLDYALSLDQIAGDGLSVIAFALLLFDLRRPDVLRHFRTA